MRPPESVSAEAGALGNRRRSRRRVNSAKPAIATAATAMAASQRLRSPPITGLGLLSGQTHEGLRSYRWGTFGEGTGAKTLRNSAKGGVSEQIVGRSEASIGFMREPWAAG